MREGKLFNLNEFSQYKSLYLFIKDFYGLGLKFTRVFEQRFETFIFKRLVFNNLQRWKIIYLLITSIIPINNNFQLKQYLNIFLLEKIDSYRGYRHMSGLPTRGQRTWCNANSVYNANTFLRQQKLKLFRHNNKEITKEHINYAFALEFYNYLWKKQWEREWLQAYHARGDQLMKKYTKVNLFLKKKNSKKAENFAIGFLPGFTKKYYKNIFAKKKTRQKK